MLEELDAYKRIRALVAEKKLDEALLELEAATLNASTKTLLQKVLQSGEEYVIERTFAELDGRVGQALCWDCWKPV